MNIIGLTSHFTGNHDNSAALLVDGKILFAESQERISRVKHDRQFPVTSIEHALKYANLKWSDIDYFVSGSPQTNLIKLLSNYLIGFKYAGFLNSLEWVRIRMRYWLKNSDEEYNAQSKSPKDYKTLGLPEEKLIYVSHHLAHGETAYHFSGMDNCLVVVLDGYGINESGFPLCGSVFIGADGKLENLEDVPVYASLGLSYGAVTVALGFKLNDGEGKTMGLAAYGKKSPVIAKLKKMFPSFNGNNWVPSQNWLEINGVSRVDYFRLTSTYQYLRFLIEEYGAEQIAYAVQQILEEEVEKYIKYLVKKFKSKLQDKKIKLATAGGVFLNVKLNSKLLEKKIVHEMFIYPNPADGGVAIGAAISAYKKLGGNMPVTALRSVDFGCDFSKKQILQAFKEFKGKILVEDLADKIYNRVARDLSNGKVVGWFQGRGEWGPRALGFRSVLADPRHEEIKERINSKLKERDWFMPFAPAILDEHKEDFLVHNFGTPFMTLTDDIKQDQVKRITAAIHVDNTARSQIVYKDINPKYWKLIYEFYKITDVPVILNTSFNKHGLPIVHSPKDAIEHLLWGCIDELVIDNYLITRK